MNIQPVILSGGSGTRLWPMSRELYPKQLLPLVTENTMLQETILRLEGLEGAEDIHINAPLVICNEEHRFLVAEQLRQLDIEPAAIILEPVGRNTAPALTLAAVCIEAAAEDAVMLVMAADHVIENKDAFHKAILNGHQQTMAEQLVTFGIVPTAPETGYGYIKKGQQVGLDNGAALIEAFVEKPDLDTAQEYLVSGQYLWNSGMFMMKASVWNRAINEFQSDIFNTCKAAYDGGKTDHDFYRIERETFESSPSDSIDYAVMERITESGGGFIASVIPLDAGWSDVGAWSSLWEVNAKDDHGNVIKGDVLAEDTENSLLIAEHGLLTTIGLKDVVVVETADAVLVADKAKAQDVKKVVQWLKEQGREERSSHRRVYRPWGSYEGIDAGERYQVKRITVNPGASLSLQMHHHRAEHWIVVKGTAKVTCDGKTYLVSENQSTYIPIGATHRLENPGKLPLEMIEVQSGGYLGEDDIVRFGDNYGRK
ncbi:MAG: mannose-1-phosphate guanylyltransferase/mannose-6-phosphate isomerase [Gammaproteobacteria bacterium]|nr:mannose-1-phosphate guanylyltransferase/mannose-6-phosphate isomerase [Gammaproteobacteria bacterium]